MKYIGVKIIDATPMKEDVALQHHYKTGLYSNPPTPVRDGYEVTYEDGYKSWSPNDVFDKAYKIIDLMIPVIDKQLLPHQERVVNETKELGKKVNKLYDFVNNNDIYHTLNKDEQDRLYQQLLAMQYYLRVLIERIKAF